MPGIAALRHEIRHLLPPWRRLAASALCFASEECVAYLLLPRTDNRGAAAVVRPRAGVGLGAKEQSMARILIVDDEIGVVNALRRMCLNSMMTPAIPDPQVMTFISPLQAIKHVRDNGVDLVISDYRMPEMDGATFLTKVKERQPDTARMILSAYTDMDGIVRAINDAGIFRFVNKPWSDADLRVAIVQVLEHRELVLENRRLANEVRVQRGIISKQQAELERLETETPGITRVRWSEDGGVLLED
jgi:response regulator RpfG family c-di-GMP phosphodiesterase